MSQAPLLPVASRLPGAWRPASAPGWGLAELVGFITELSAQGASATASLAMRLAWEAQCAGEPVAWVSGCERCFFPGDAVQAGLDLAALAVARVPDATGLGKAADYLVRSGAFGLVVIDMGPEQRLPERQLTRLLGLARKHATAIVCLTAKPEAAPSLGGLVSLRGPVRRTRLRPGEFASEFRASKDKRRAPGWGHVEVYRGPAGLR